MAGRLCRIKLLLRVSTELGVTHPPLPAAGGRHLSPSHRGPACSRGASLPHLDGVGTSSILRSVPLPQPGLGRAPGPPSAPSSLPLLPSPTPGSLCSPPTPSTRGTSPASAPGILPLCPPPWVLGREPGQWDQPSLCPRRSAPLPASLGSRGLYGAAGRIPPPPLHPGQFLARKQNCWVNWGK